MYVIDLKKKNSRPQKKTVRQDGLPKGRGRFPGQVLPVVGRAETTEVLPTAGPLRVSMSQATPAPRVQAQTSQHHPFHQLPRGGCLRCPGRGGPDTTLGTPGPDSPYAGHTGLPGSRRRTPVVCLPGPPPRARRDRYHHVPRVGCQERQRTDTEPLT